ncbi:hypothetical protein PTKIN_Ptkin04bG0220300 [Pterospermum kingtungense]
MGSFGPSLWNMIKPNRLSPLRFSNQKTEMEKTFTLLQTIATAGVFSAVSCWYGFMFGRESARKELGDLIESLRRNNPDSSSSSPPPHS